MKSALRGFRETSRGHIMGLEHGMLKMLFSLKPAGFWGCKSLRRGNRADPYRASGAEPEGHG